LVLNILHVTYFVTSVTARKPRNCDIDEIFVNGVSAPYCARFALSCDFHS